MKVLFLTHRLPYAANRGDRIRAYYLLRELSRVADVSLFSLVHDEAEAAQVDRVPFARQVTTVRVPRVRNLLRGPWALASAAPLTHVLLDAPSVTPTLERLVAADPPDVVVAYCSGMARFAMSAPLNRWPLVLDLVDVDSAKWASLAPEVTLWRRWVYRREARTLAAFERRAAERAASVLVVNAREAETLRQISPAAPVQVVPNGVELEAFRPTGPPSPDPIVAFCGVMDYFPNEDGVVWFADAVWPRVRAARPDARFVIVGSGPGPRIHQLARRDPSIEVTGRVDSVQPYLWRSAVGVAPLRIARGLQNKVLEALAAGLPAVVTPTVLAGLPDAARDGCASADDPDRFAAAVLQLLALSPAERRARAGQARLEGLSWATQLAPIARLLAQAVGSTDPSSSRASRA
jgi:sugar transferase (PEP-CTERM/EpsH1 system associated)